MKFLKGLYRKIQLSKINFLNHKFKKYIIKYEENGKKIKVYNSNGDYKYVDNTIANKVKIMEIIKDHNIEIDNEISFYKNNINDYKFIIIFSLLILIVLGLFTLFTFFIGNNILFIVANLIFLTTLLLSMFNIYKIYIFREEVKRLETIKNNKLVLDDEEVLTLIKDATVYIKNYLYEIILKVLDIFDGKKSKIN